MFNPKERVGEVVSKSFKMAGAIQMSGQTGVYLAVVFGLLPFGAVHDLPKIIVGVVAAVTTLIAIRRDIKRTSVSRLERHAWWLLIFTAIYILLQSLSFDGNPAAHPFWETAGQLADFHHGAISVEPSLTRFGLFSLVPPFLLFVAILHAFQGDEEAWLLIRFLGLVGVAFVVYGIAQALFFPNHVLFRELAYANTRLTGTLINRNHAATVSGLTSLLILANVLHKAKGIPLLRFPIVVFFPSRLSHERRWPLVLWSVALLFSFIALFMTQSRGGFGATLVAWGLLLPLLLSRAMVSSGRGRSGFQSSRHFRSRRILFVFLFLLVIGGFIGIYAEGTIFRIADAEGTNTRFCNFPAMWAVFLDNWVFGSGFATFEVMFPIYRSPACGLNEIWTQAHNFWLEGLMGLGVIFVPVAIFALVRLVASYLTGSRTRRSQRFASSIGLASMILVFLHAFVDFSLQIPGVSLYVSAILAAFCILSLQRSH